MGCSRNAHPFAQWNENVSVPSELHAISPGGFEHLSQRLGDRQNEVFLHEPALAMRARIDPAMTGIQDDEFLAASRRNGRGRALRLNGRHRGRDIPRPTRMGEEFGSRRGSKIDHQAKPRSTFGREDFRLLDPDRHSEVYDETRIAFAEKTIAVTFHWAFARGTGFAT